MFKTLISAFITFVLAGCVSTGAGFKNVPLGSSDDAKIESITGILSKPSGKGPFPAIAILHTCGGVMPHVSEDWPRFLNAQGYVTLTVDTFGSRLAGKCPYARYLQGKPMVRDAYGALEHLASMPDVDGNRIGVIGFSLGAMAIELMATNFHSPRKITTPSALTFAAGISVYGRCEFTREADFPVLAIIGDHDKHHMSCPGVTNKLLGIKSPSVSNVSANILPGAYHGFDNSVLTTMRVVSGDHKAVYDGNATRTAEKLVARFFGQHLGK